MTEEHDYIGELGLSEDQALMCLYYGHTIALATEGESDSAHALAHQELDGATGHSEAWRLLAEMADAPDDATEWANWFARTVADPDFDWDTDVRRMETMGREYGGAVLGSVLGMRVAKRIKSGAAPHSQERWQAFLSVPEESDSGGSEGPD